MIEAADVVEARRLAQLLNSYAGVIASGGKPAATFLQQALEQASEMLDRLVAVKKPSAIKPPVEPGEGWGFPRLAKKIHYFQADSRSLCGKWAYTGEREYKTIVPHLRDKECRQCFNRLMKWKNIKPTPPKPVGPIVV